MGRAPEAALITGTASYRERIALPPGAVLKAVLEDVSVADQPAIVIARTSFSPSSGPPIPFSIPFDSTRIDARHIYSVRARILVDGQPRFMSDQAHPVLTGGAGRTVDILLRMVHSDPGGAEPRGSSGGTRLMGGEMVYMADAARFTDCMSGRSYPIAMEEDFQRMQRAYMDHVSAPGGRLYVTFEGTVADRPGMEEGSGGAPTVVVSSFIDAWPNQNCARSRAHADLVNTYWRLTRLGDQSVMGENGPREPHLLLQDVDGERSFAATVGCNQLLGAYTVTNRSPSPPVRPRRWPAPRRSTRWSGGWPTRSSAPADGKSTQTRCSSWTKLEPGSPCSRWSISDWRSMCDRGAGHRNETQHPR